MSPQPMTAATLSAREPPSAARLRDIANSLHAAGDTQAGGEAHLRALVASVREPNLAAAAAALNKSDLAIAERLLKQQLKEHPTDIGAMRMLAELAIRLARYGDAIALLDRALDLAPAFDAARFARALALSRVHRLPEAGADTERLLARAPDNISYLNLRASLLVRLGDYEAAYALYQRVLKARPDQPKIWMSLGHVLKTMGRTADGIEAYRTSLAQKPDLGESWWSLANLKTFRFTDADIAVMESALGVPEGDAEDVFHLHFALGKAFEDRSEFERSFSHYAQGNTLRRKQLDYDPARITDQVTRHIATLTPEFFASRRGNGCDAPDPIFIVGLPRAGSTLVEQILASHLEIEGTMELPDLDKIARRLAERGGDNALRDLTPEASKALGEEYIERTRIQRRLGRRSFIDKLPNNWLHVGLIQLILPNAKIIDARREPMACCFSAWKQHFARGQSFSYDLAELGAYYSDYVRFLDHVDAVSPGRVHRVIHEDLVNDPEGEIRRLLAYVGVAFDQRCLAFHETERAVRTASSEQVRRPISRDGLEQWRKYETWLAPLASALSPTIEHWRGAAGVSGGRVA